MRRAYIRMTGTLVLVVALLALPGCIVITGSDGGGGSTLAPAATTDAAPTSAEIVAAVKSIVKKNRADVSVASVENIKTFKDDTGVWWVGATAVPVDPTHFDQVPVYIQRENGVWRLFELGTGIEASDLPPAVRSIAQ